MEIRAGLIQPFTGGERARDLDATQMEVQQNKAVSPQGISALPEMLKHFTASKCNCAPSLTLVN